MITLHTWTTPNGRKVSIVLEELGIAYDVNAVNLGKNAQFASEFLAISPNNTVFAIASLGCAAAPDLSWLWAFRVMQGVSAGAGTVVGRAIIRDVHAGPPAARLRMYWTSVMVVAFNQTNQG